MRLNTVNILGIHITSTSASLVLGELIDFVAKPASPLVIFTPNPEFLVEAVRDLSFRELLNRSDINLPDGIGLVWASRILGAPIRERVSGADVVGELLEYGNKLWVVGCGSGMSCEDVAEKWVVGIAGARRGVLSESHELGARLGVKYPHLQFINLDEPELKIKNLKLKIALACHGMKKQEQWILENKDKINANVFMGVGGSLDFITGFTKRSPLWMRRTGLEWLWRGLQRPGHWKRIWKAVVVFGWMVMREYFKLKTQNSNVKTKT